MTFTVAILILAVGILIGYRLPGPIAALKERYRRYRFKPELLRPYDVTAELNTETTPKHD